MSKVNLDFMKSKEYQAAKTVVNDWLENQLRPEGRKGIYIDDEGALIYEIYQVIKSQLEREQKCVELAVSAFEAIIETEKFCNGEMVSQLQEDCLEVITKIRSLREQK